MNFWWTNFLWWVFFGSFGLINIFFLCLFLGGIYTLYLSGASFLLNRPWKELHAETIDLAINAYTQSTLSEAIFNLVNAIVFSISHIMRGLILPIKLLSGLWVNILIGPIEKS